MLYIVNFIELLLKIKYTEFKDRPKKFINLWECESFFLPED